MTFDPYASNDLDRDGDCDDIAIFERWFGKCEDEGYNEFTDADHDGCLTKTDRQLLFPYGKCLVR